MIRLLHDRGSVGTGGHHRGRVLVVMLALGVPLLLLAVLHAVPTLAASATPKDSDPLVMAFDGESAAAHEAQLTIHLMSDKNTGRVAYCYGTTDQFPPNTGASLEYAGKVQDPVLDYVAYHGYTGDTSISIGTVTGDAEALYLATQLAIYDAIKGSASYSESFFSEDSQYRYIADAATQLYNEAVAYKNAGAGGPEAGTAIYYLGENNRQDILTIVLRGTIRINKVSSLPEVSDTSDSYSLAGAEYKVYSDSDLTTEVADLVTDEDGTAVTTYLPYGEYWVREVRAPKGFSLNDRTVRARLSKGQLTLPMQDEPAFAKVDVVVEKVDAETGGTSPLGSGSLSGARFAVDFYAGADDPDHLPESPTRSWIVETDDDGRASLDSDHIVGGDELYTFITGEAILPIGVVAVRETSAPEGYLLPDVTTWYYKVGEESAGEAIRLVQDPVRERPVRGDLSFTKVSGDGSQTMPGVLFRVTSETTGESHIVRTDEDGSFSSRATPHSQDTNSLDSTVDDEGHVDEGKASVTCGTWFYGYQDGATSEVDDTRGAFPYDTYVFEELASEASLGHELVSFRLTVDADGTTVDGGTVRDTPVTLTTEATDSSDGDKYLARAVGVTIQDHVTYTGLTPGSEYVLTCTLVDAESGEAIVGDDGGQISANVSFVPETSDGTQDVTLSLDATQLGPSVVVAYERLTRDNLTIATHEDRQDPDQTLYVPRIDTVLAEGADGGHEVEASSSTSLVDTVSYEGLVPGTTYSLVGRLVDGETGETVVDGSGSPVAASASLTPESPSGTASVSYSFDSTGLGDHSVVAFETLQVDGSELCGHEDLDDADQTVTIARHQATLPETGSSSGAIASALSGALAILGVLSSRMMRRP